MRVKPLTRKERADIKVKLYFIQNKEALLVSKARDGIRLKIDENKFRSFRFSRVFSEASSNQEVFRFSAKKFVDKFLQGFNSSIFAYGQTGTGKLQKVLLYRKDLHYGTFR